MDESDGLENRCGGNVTVGSNPTLSASFGHEKGSQIYSLSAFFFNRCARTIILVAAREQR